MCPRLGVSTKGNQGPAPPPPSKLHYPEGPGSGGMTPPCAQAPFPENYITQKAQEEAVRLRLVRRRGGAGSRTRGGPGGPAWLS